jgi:uroporphyrinogen-III synthase
MRYAIAVREDGTEHSPVIYWTTRVGDTDNYSYDKADAATFMSASHAKALMQTLGLDDNHFVIYA